MAPLSRCPRESSSQRPLRLAGPVAREKLLARGRHRANTVSPRGTRPLQLHKKPFAWDSPKA
eukprot:6996613-Lingulodinium_polyedra.AAC.1